MLEDRNAPNGLGNSSPFAADDWFDLLHDSTLFANLLWNDYDPDGDTLSITRINGQTYTPGTQITLQDGDLIYGYLTVGQDGSFTFTPTLRYKGQVSFSYTISDGEYESTAWVTINVFNNMPQLSDQEFSILHDQDLVGNLLSGAYDPDGNPIRVTHINGQAISYGEPMSLPSGGSLTVWADGTFSYTPPPNFTGADSFSLTISDDLDSYTAMVNILVTNNAPHAYDASFSVLHDRELVGQLYGYDSDGDAITAQLVAGPSNGTLTLHPDGTFTYIPNTHYVGGDSFTYTWSDGLTSGNTATIMMDVYNNAPYAYDASFSVLHDRELVGQLYGYDPDGDAITAQLVSGPSNGTLTFHPDGSFTYTPNRHYVGPDSFTYTWSDGLTTSNTASVSIEVYSNGPQGYYANLRFAYDHLVVSEGVGEVLVSVVADQPLSEPAEFYVEVAGGTAVEGADYHVMRGHVQMAGGQQELSFPVLHIVDDAVLELEETVVLRLVAVSGALVTQPDMLAVTIEDNDVHAPLPPQPAQAVLLPDSLLPGQEQRGQGLYQVSLASGALSLAHSLVNYHTNVPTLQLLYNSNTADVRPIFIVRHSLQTAARLVTAQLSVAGASEPAVYLDTSGVSPGSTLLFSLQAHAQNLPTGRYDYTITVSEQGDPGGEASTTYSGAITLVNRNSSALGPGWTLSEMLSLVITAEGVALVRPDGTTAWFAWDPGTGTYISPPGLMAHLERQADGSFLLQEHHGTAEFFDAAGRLLRVSDRNGNVISYTYDSEGQLVARTEPAGQTTLFTYTGGLLTDITDPAGRVTHLTYDSSGRLTAITAPDPDGPGEQRSPVEQFSYDSDGHVIAYTDPRGYRTSFVYDAAGRVQRIERPDGSTEFFQATQPALLLTPENAGPVNPAPARTGDHPTAAYTDGNGHTWQMELDNLGFGLAVSRTDPLGNTTYIARDANGLPIRVIDPLGRTTDYAYDSEGNLISYVLPTGAVYQYSYNNFGEVTQIVAPDPDQDGPRVAPVTRFVYDDRGNLLQWILPDDDNDPQNNPRYIYTYTTEGYKGLLASVTNPRGYTTQYVYNSSGQLIRIVYPDDDTDPANNPSVQFTYDAYGNLASRTDERGYTWHYVYDALNRLVREVRPEGDSWYQYDAAGNLVATVDDFGNATTYTYDPMNRLAAVTGPDPDGDGPQVPAVTRYSYDGAGNLVRVTDPVGRQTNFTYDSANRLVRRTIGASHTYDYEYDASGDLIRLFYPAPDPDNPQARLTIAYTYNNLRQVTSISNNLGQRVSYNYNWVGELDGFT